MSGHENVALDRDRPRRHGFCAEALAANEVRPLGEPQLERPTLHSLGVYWIVQGDDNKNAAVKLEYRQVDSADWRLGAPLFRVERKAHNMQRFRTQLKVPDDGWLFAGSVLLVETGTAYELKVTLNDPDGKKSVTRTLRSQTRTEPCAPAGMRIRHVVPGNKGGAGTVEDPFQGLAAADKAAIPGDLFLVHPGVYHESFRITKSGQEGKPIIWRGSGQGEAVIDPRGRADKPPAVAVDAARAQDVWFEDLTIRNAQFGLGFNDANRIVIRRCRVSKVDYALAATRDVAGVSNDHFISDNVLEGPSTWPRTKGIEDARGIQVTGQGHVVCYNRIRGFADAIDTFPSIRCAGHRLPQQ